jgi:hypothetical protein
MARKLRSTGEGRGAERRKISGETFEAVNAIEPLSVAFNLKLLFELLKQEF